MEKGQLVGVECGILDVAEFGLIIAAIELHCDVAVGRGVQADGLGGWVRFWRVGECVCDVRISIGLGGLDGLSIVRTVIAAMARLVFVGHRRRLVARKPRRNRSRRCHDGGGRFNGHASGPEATCDQ